MTTPRYGSGLIDSMIGTVANSLLMERDIYSPTEPETEEVRRLAETIVRETVDKLAGPQDLSTRAHRTPVDITELLATDPETASVDQLQEVAIALRGLLILRDALAGVDRR